MTLIEQFPTLSHRTIWAQFTPWQERIVWGIITHEREFARPLPDWAFYKRVAARLVREAIERFKEN